MERHRRRLPRPLRYLVVRIGANILLLAFMSAPLPLAGQKADTLSTALVTGSRAPGIVKPAEEVRLGSVPAAPLQVADVISSFTGVQVKDYGGAGGLKTVNVRSLGSEHVGVFIDGIQTDNAQNMQVDLGRFSTDGLGTVALYNGQKSDRLQTAKEYASGAAVHLLSERPAGNRLLVRMRGGSFGTVSPSLQWDRGMRRTALRAGAEFLGSNGRYRFPCFDTTLVRENGDIRSLRLETQLFGQLDRGQWNLRLYGYGSERGFPGPVIRRASGFPLSTERQTDQDSFLQGAWLQDWSDSYATALRFKVADNYTHYDAHPEKNPMALPFNLHYRQRSTYLSLAQSLTISEPLSADLSADLQHQSLDTDAWRAGSPRRTTFTGALAGRGMWEHLRAAAHLAYQAAWDDAGMRSAWMPSACISWQPSEHMEISAFAKRSYRLPSFNDLYYSVTGNQNLRPESAAQAGAELRMGGGEDAARWEVRLAPYFNRVRDKIVAVPTSSQFRWSMLNIGKADITGLDARGTVAAEPGRWHTAISVRYSFQRALDHSNPESLTWGNQIPYIPVHSGSVETFAAHGGWQLRWSTLITGERWSRSANTADYHIDPWSSTDVSLARIFDPGTSGRPEITLRLLCRNIFNCRYEVVQGYPMPGANFFVCAEFKW